MGADEIVEVQVLGARGGGGPQGRKMGTHMWKVCYAIATVCYVVPIDLHVDVINVVITLLLVRVFSCCYCCCCCCCCYYLFLFDVFVIVVDDDEVVDDGGGGVDVVVLDSANVAVAG